MDLDVPVDFAIRQEVHQAGHEIVKKIDEHFRLTISQVADDTAREATGDTFLGVKCILQILRNFIELENLRGTRRKTLNDDQTSFAHIAVLFEHIDDHGDNVLARVCIDQVTNLDKDSLHNCSEDILSIGDCRINSYERSFLTHGSVQLLKDGHENLSSLSIALRATELY